MTKLVMTSMAMIAPRSLLSCRNAKVRSEGISLGGFASTASIPFVSVGDAIVEHLRWRLARAGYRAPCRKVFSGPIFRDRCSSWIVYVVQCHGLACEVSTAHGDHLSLAQQKFALVRNVGCVGRREGVCDGGEFGLSPVVPWLKQGLSATGTILANAGIVVLAPSIR
jgi:hypothetical protein